MNKWIITGRLTKEPRVIQTDSGSIVGTIYLAIKRDFKNKETGAYESDFFRFKAFGKTADFIHSFIKQGDLVEVEASVKNNNYEKDGEMLYNDENIIRTISKLSSPKKAPEQ